MLDGAQLCGGLGRTHHLLYYLAGPLVLSKTLTELTDCPTDVIFITESTVQDNVVRGTGACMWFDVTTIYSVYRFWRNCLTSQAVIFLTRLGPNYARVLS